MPAATRVVMEIGVDTQPIGDLSRPSGAFPRIASVNCCASSRVGFSATKPDAVMHVPSSSSSASEQSPSALASPSVDAGLFSPKIQLKEIGSFAIASASAFGMFNENRPFARFFFCTQG
jgi:hypothetical protein